MVAVGDCQLVAFLAVRFIVSVAVLVVNHGFHDILIHDTSAYLLFYCNPPIYLRGIHTVAFPYLQTIPLVGCRHLRRGLSRFQVFGVVAVGDCQLVAFLTVRLVVSVVIFMINNSFHNILVNNRSLYFYRNRCPSGNCW